MTTRCVAFSPGIAHAHALGRDANDPARTPSRAVGLRRRSQSRAAACVRFSPVAFALRRRHARAGRAPRRARRSSAPRGAETLGTFLPVSRTITATSSSPVRPSRRHAARSSAALLHTCAAPFWPDASLEVLSPSALAGPRCAVASGHAVRRSRFGVCSPVDGPRVRGPSVSLRSPLRFSAVRTRCGASSMRERLWLACARPCGWRVAGRDGDRTELQVITSVCDRPCGGPIGGTDLIARHERPVASSATASIVRCPGCRHAPSLALGRCSATRGPSLRGLAGR
jgi:hypothetical protein